MATAPASASAAGAGAAVAAKLADAPVREATASEDALARQAAEAALAEARRASVLEAVTATASGWLKTQPGADLVAKPEEAEAMDTQGAAKADTQPGANGAQAQANEATMPAMPSAMPMAKPFAREPAAGIDRRV